MRKTTRSKIQLCLISFGVIIGIVGILHGIPEILQGSSLVESHSVKALPENWPNQELFTVLNGQPAYSMLTGIPFYLLGILAIAVSTALIIHCVFFLERKNGLLMFALLNVGVALLGAGVGTPLIMGIPLVIFGIIANRYPRKKERRESTDQLNLLLFRIFYALQIASWVLFFPGFVIISSFGKIPEAVFMIDFMIMPISILGALIFGLRYEHTAHPQKDQALA
ncbi:MAG: hypothetical protein AAFR61_12885 [Bacteroidota bacterium]